MAYDPKVAAVLRYIAQKNLADLESLTVHSLQQMIDWAVEDAKHLASRP